MEAQNLANALYAVASPCAHSEGFQERRELVKAIADHVITREVEFFARILF